MRSYSVLPLLCILFSSSLAHDWMSEPVPRNGGQASTNGPCDVNTPGKSVRAYQQGVDITVNWDNGHKQSNHILSIAPKGQDTAAASFKQLVSVAASQTQQHPQVYTLSASALADYKPGYYTLRYSWTNYANCADIALTAPAPDNSVSGAGKPNPLNSTETLTSIDYIIIDPATKEQVGVFNSITTKTSCISGYEAAGETCAKPPTQAPSDPSNNKDGGSNQTGTGSKGMSGGGKAALAIFFIALAATVVAAVFYHEKGHVFGWSNDSVSKVLKAKPREQPASVGRGGNYVAYPVTNA
eukprot:TRINITY_DN12063_c0_g1_i1.p1 TRINITY_DN12063_c0_g1~~TRINITY_DN12063_c0_g1_i1.p1  ORF type:complete len:298 (-),score=116.38 TRINITY_DN12063_c0_g1_i1:115-1008(-)